MKPNKLLSTYIVDPEYCGFVIAVCNEADQVTNLAKTLESARCQGWILQSPRHIFAFFQVGLHPESLFGALSTAHGTTEAQTFIVGRLCGRQLLPGQTYMVLKIPIATAMWEELIDKLCQATNNTAIVLLDPFEGNIWVLTPSAALLVSDKLTGLTQFEYDNALMVTASTSITKVSTISRSAKSYDPLEAQIHEILNSQAEWLMEESSRIEEASRRLRLDNIGYSVSSVAQHIVKSLVEEGRNSLKFLDNQDMRDSILILTDRISHEFAKLTYFLANIRAALIDNGASSILFGNARHSAKSQKGTISAASILVKEFGNRIWSSDSSPFLVSYGEYFSAVRISDWFKLFDWNANDIPDLKNLPDIISLPDWCSGRLGALPVLAHEVGHIVASQKGKVPLTELFLEVERIHGANVVPDSSKQRSHLYLTIEKHIKIMKEKQQRLSILQNWTNELAADLIACALCGPAYLFAFARFALGNLYAIGSGKELIWQTHPRTSSRLRTCEWALQKWGFKLNFHSNYLPDVVPLLIENEDLLQLVRDAIPRPYSVMEHSIAVNGVESSLHGGELIQADPTLLLNALWHSVVNKTGYANEIALAYSLLNSRLSAPTTAST